MAGRREGQILVKGEGAWLVRWYVGRLPTGRYKYKSEVVKGSRRAAERKLREVLRLRDQGVELDTGRITLDQHLDDWLVQLEGKKARRTLDHYRTVFRLYVRPVLGPRRLDKITLGHIEDDLIAGMRERGLSGRTIRLAVSILGAAFKWGTRRGRLIRNPAESAHVPQHRPKEMMALTPDQVRAFREAVADDPHAALYDFLLFTGCRPGEALALRWKDLDLEAGVARIQQALSRWAAKKQDDGKVIEKAGWEFRDPKAGSARVVPLPPSLIASLRAHRKVQGEYALKLGTKYRRELDLVFANEDGGPLEGRNLVQRSFKPALLEAKLPATVRLYDLRHTHASNLLAAGAPIKAVADRLGHASAKMTLDRYAHVLAGQGERLASVVEELFAN
jgi:integrase